MEGGQDFLYTAANKKKNGKWPRLGHRYVLVVRAHHALNSMFLQKLNSEYFWTHLALSLLGVYRGSIEGDNFLIFSSDSNMFFVNGVCSVWS